MTSSVDEPFDLNRFVVAQAREYAQALAELRAGRKQSHWMWYVLPQLRGLGSSRMANLYAIGSLAEARAYLAHPILGPRLRECVAALNGLAGLSAVDVLGEVDAAKLRSCLTLFAEVAGDDPGFIEGLNKYFQGLPDRRTLSLLSIGTGQSPRS